jgi:hypothetical protein
LQSLFIFFADKFSQNIRLTNEIIPKRKLGLDESLKNELFLN